MPFATGGGGIHDDGYHTGSAKRAVANGVASLDATAYVPAAELALAELLTRKNVASGYAGLNAGAKVPVANLPTNVANGIAGLDVSSTVSHAIKKVASANVRNSHDAAVWMNVGAYTLAKTITFVYGLRGTARFLFDLAESQTVGTVYGRIYRNGVALGSVQSMVGVGWVTKSEDITQTWGPGDTCELWIYRSNAPTQVGVQNFRIAYDDIGNDPVESGNS